VVVRQCSIKGMRLEGTSCNVLITSSVSLIGTCVKRDSTSKLISSLQNAIGFFGFFE